MNTYEKNTQNAKVQRAFGYALLWMFLAALIAWLSTLRNIPTVELVVGVLAIIGVIKLIYAIKFYREERKQL